MLRILYAEIRETALHGAVGKHAEYTNHEITRIASYDGAMSSSENKCLRLDTTRENE